MHRAIKPASHHLRYAAGIVAIGLVDLCLQHRSHVPCLNTDHRQVGFTKRAEKPLRQRPSLQSDPLKAVGRIPWYPKQSIGLAGNLNLPNDFTRAIHNADARVLDRNVQSRKMIHAALLLLMLEAAHAALVSPSACKAAPKNLLAIHKPPADYPIFWHKADILTHLVNVRFRG